MTIEEMGRTVPLRLLRIGLMVTAFVAGCTAASFAEEPPTTAAILAGSGVMLSASGEDADTAVLPQAKVWINAPIYLGSGAVGRINASVTIGGEPGVPVDLTSPRGIETFRSAEPEIELQRRIGASRSGTSSTYAVLRYGVSVRMNTRKGIEPADRSADWFGGGFRFEGRDRDGKIVRSLGAIYGRSQIANPQRMGPGQAILDGHTKLRSVLGADLVLGGDAHLQVGSPRTKTGGQHAIRLYLAVQS